MIIITTMTMTTWDHQVKGKLPSLYPSWSARRDVITGQGIMDFGDHNKT